MYKSIAWGMLSAAFVFLVVNQPIAVAGALVAAGLFAVADAIKANG